MTCAKPETRKAGRHPATGGFARTQHRQPPPWHNHKWKCPCTLDIVPPMNGTISTTGRRLGGIDHLRQSVRDILATPLDIRGMYLPEGRPILLDGIEMRR